MDEIALIDFEKGLIAHIGFRWKQGLKSYLHPSINWNSQWLITYRGLVSMGSMGSAEPINFLEKGSRIHQILKKITRILTIWHKQVLKLSNFCPSKRFRTLQLKFPAVPLMSTFRDIFSVGAIFAIAPLFFEKNHRICNIRSTSEQYLHSS